MHRRRLSDRLSRRSRQAQVAGATASANPSVPSIPTVVNIGPNHRVFQWQTLEPMPTGQMTPHLHQYTELCLGLTTWMQAEHGGSRRKR